MNKKDKYICQKRILDCELCMTFAHDLLLFFLLAISKNIQISICNLLVQWPRICQHDERKCNQALRNVIWDGKVNIRKYFWCDISLYQSIIWTHLCLILNHINRRAYINWYLNMCFEHPRCKFHACPSHTLYPNKKSTYQMSQFLIAFLLNHFIICF